LVLHAQDSEGSEDDEYEGGINIESDWSRAANLYNSGDQFIGINLGLVKPLFFIEQEEGYLKTQMRLGGFLSLTYNYFLDPHWYLGAELGGMFTSTVGKNMFYIVPIGFSGGYQLIWNRFEFPFSLLLGFAPQVYSQMTYFGFFSKLAAGIFYRFNSEWSFGLNTSFWWVPQWTKKSRPFKDHSDAINIHGFFWENSLGVRYHF
jgi:hypothetical protein